MRPIAQQPSSSGIRAQRCRFPTAPGAREELTCVEEGGDGHAANQVLQEEALSGDEDGHKGRQRVVEGKVAYLGKGGTETIEAGKREAEKVSREELYWNYFKRLSWNGRRKSIGLMLFKMS